MKKVFSLVLIFALVSAMFALWVNAEGECTITGASVTAEAGQTVDVAFTLAGNPGFAYIKATVSVDEGLTISGVSKDGQTVGYDSFMTAETTGGVNVLIDSMPNATGNGLLFTVSVAVAEGATGEMAVKVAIVEAYDEEAEDVTFVVTNGKVTVEEELPPQPAALHAMSFNTVWVDGAQICDTGDALAFLAENPITGDVQNIGVRGWAWIDNSTIDTFGYKLDGGEPVFDAAFTQDRPDVYAQAGATQATANGFNINPIDVSALGTGDHTVTVLVKAADGSIVEVVTAPFSIERPLPPAALHAHSFNTVWVDGAQICDTGDALAFLAENPITGDVQNIGVRGWAWIDNSTIEAFGYKLDGGEPVFDAAFTQDRPDVYAQAGATQATANGFNINPIDVSALGTGDHTVTVLVKAADGSIVEVVTAPFSIERPLPAPALIMCNMDLFELNGKVLTVAGWAGANYPANNLGYRIDGGEPILDGIEFHGFYSDAEADIIHANAGEYAFRFVSVASGIDLSSLTDGEHTITLVVRVDGPEGNAIIDMKSKTFTVTSEVPAAKLHAKSFNTVWVDGTQVCDTGDALGYLAENPITGDVQTIGVRGWAWIDNSNITAFGYKLDDGEPVFDTAFTQDRPDVYAQAGATQATANGFNINPVDVSALATGDHTITVLVEAEDGTIIEVVTAPFSVERPAPQDPVALHAMSFDTLWLDYVQQVDGGAGAWIEANPNFGFINIISVRGWAWIDNGTIESFGYGIDEGEPVFDAAYIQDRADLGQVLGTTTDICNGFFINPIDVSGLKAGDHRMRLYVKATDGSVVEITSFAFTLERAGWLCNSASGVAIPGLWMTQPDQYIDINFTSPEAFKGFCAMIYSNAQGVKVNFSLIHDGKELESFEYSQAGDAAPTLFFSRAYPAGTYTLKITLVEVNPHPDVGYGWFVLGTSDPIDNGYPVTIEGTHTLGAPADGHPDSLTAPLMFLVLAADAEPLPAAYSLLNVSYDELLYDGTQILSTSVYQKLVELEDPSILDFEEGTINNITVRGWVRISENAADIVGFGYSIDGGEVVQGEFVQDRTAELSGAGFPGGQGFIVEVPVADLAAGAHTIDVYVIAADGSQIKVVKVKNDVEYQVGVTFNVTESAVVPQPTSDIAIVAIAAVACVAAAGVVIGKKKLGK